jgi:subtilase family serine protease
LESSPEIGELTINPGGDATGSSPNEFSMLAAEGVATFVSTGDAGSAACEGGLTSNPNINYPSDVPNAVAVGGTNTPVGPNGRLTGPITGWGDTTESGGASTAGVSMDFQTPPYQTSNSVTPYVAACTMRCVPDVDMDGDPYTGVPLIYDTGVSGGAMNEPIGGTSVAAPEMAAMWAVVLSACKVTPSCGGGYSGHVSDPVAGYTAPAAPSYRLGNPNYLWYNLAHTAQATAYHNTFYDIVYGNDGEPIDALGVVGSELGGGPDEYEAGIVPGTVYAGPGIDEDTGLGAPFARALIKYIVGV